MTRPEKSQGAIVQPMVLIVDDDPSVREALGSLLAPRLEPFYRVETAASAGEITEVVFASSMGWSRLGTPSVTRPAPLLTAACPAR